MWKKTVFRAMAMVFLTCGVSFAATYDLTKDFSNEANPNGVWSYGWSQSRGTTFNLDTQSYTGWWFGNVKSWVNDAEFSGANNHILYAVSDVSHPTVSVPAGTVSVHPGPSGQNTVIRWTAPATRNYRIEGSFTGNDFAYPTTTDVAILLAGHEIFTGNINSYRIPLFFSLVQQVNAGETIDFTVGFGNGSYYGDSTGLQATIREDVLQVAIDIKPGSYPNAINLTEKGVIPVAVLGSAFLKVRQINPATLLLENMPVQAVASGKLLVHYDDINGDGIEDLVVQFANTGSLPVDATTATLIGNLYDSTMIKGSDSVFVVQ